ncbi:MAG: hypothetical protein HN336_00565 [Lentimicrobiaceae bacterium]|jgi:glycosyltransferase involved in cell wall biosynthesis|nr:hypothetical protein [Lentimicrobiaceae bacterium]MCP4910877.1 hypothetical protein [Bacteroidota bacterium]MBT3453843.1 hypothetical protein [Lentimicrobiaceae bacterium]MBT3819522.1 hypothetical protein [Lentimicrobiaceae bacterium]MBT4061663.1 hypothetical protein [Lentimicrobiaceae bacterium]
MVEKPNIFVSLPVINESQNIPSLLDCLKSQTLKSYKLVVCVNQYDEWWENDGFKPVCLDNLKSLQLFSNTNEFDVVLIDKSSKGNGWTRKKGGVGWARKILMDKITNIAGSSDIIVSIDADTYYPPNYLQVIQDFFVNHNNLLGLALPYYHRLDGNHTDRLILRYEIYMRYYLLNMMRINNPYGFTALGSAMAFPVWAYKKVGGLTPVAAGEDFYFLQKLIKSGRIGIWADTIAYPSPRLSSRVAFGTGPALIKGLKGDWTSYPNYNISYFDDIKASFDTFTKLFNDNVYTPMDEYLAYKFNNQDIWAPLRNNYRDKDNFIKACVNKIDGLRILQFLHWKVDKNDLNSERNLFVFLSQFLKSSENKDFIDSIEDFDFENIDIDSLKNIRDILFKNEMHQRKTQILNYN